MSGGHWGYMSEKLTNQGKSVSAAFALLGQIEHELDWGICCDSCRDCASNRVVKALELFFDTECSDAMTALAVLRDGKQNLCDRHKERAR